MESPCFQIQSMPLARVTARTLSAALLLLLSTPSFTQAVTGPGLTGGGNATPDKRVSEQKLLEAISAAKVAAPAFFASLEGHAYGAPQFLNSYSEVETRLSDYEKMKLLEELFPETEKNIFRVLPQVTWDIRLDAPCKVPKASKIAKGAFEGADASASYGPNGEPVLCLSVPRLRNRKKITEVNASRKVFALVAHELSHFTNIGLTNEKLAKVIQDFADRAALETSELDPTRMAQEKTRTYRGMAYKMSQALEQIKKAVNAGASYEELCTEIVSAEAAFEKPFDSDIAYRLFTWFAPARGEAHLRLRSIAESYLAMSSACLSRDEKTYAAAFGGKPTVDLFTFLSRKYASAVFSSAPATMPDEQISFIAKGDRATLVGELERTAVRVNRLSEFKLPELTEAK